MVLTNVQRQEDMALCIAPSAVIGRLLFLTITTFIDGGYSIGQNDWAFFDMARDYETLYYGDYVTLYCMVSEWLILYCLYRNISSNSNQIINSEGYYKQGESHRLSFWSITLLSDH